MIEVFYESTPNPNSLKFVVTTPIAKESVHFATAQETLVRSPLANKIFGFPWAAGVFIGPTFVTVTKQDWVDWEILADPLAGLIKEHLERGEPVLVEVAAADAGASDDGANDSPIVKQIKQILQDEIRPAVAMDGGDIVFDRFDSDSGRVYLKMHGACSGCPSSTYTLKEGIETRLRAAIPSVVEVVPVMN